MRNNSYVLKLGEVANITKLAGFEHTEYIQPNATSTKIQESDVPMYIGLNIKNGKLTNKIHWYIPKDLSIKLERSALTKKCIVLPYVGSVGDLAIYDHKDRHHLASNVAKIELQNEDKFTIEYLYYYLKSPYGQKQLLFYIQGGVQKNITMDAIRKTEIRVINKYQDVVSILSKIDSKIELNNCINAELVQMSKTLYDYWFVQFDFPNENGKPYKSSGGKMVRNKELKREIPEMWKVQELSSVISKSGTGLNPRNNFKLGLGENYYITIKNVKNGKLIFDESCDKIDDETLKIIDKRSDLQVGDILFTSIEPVGITYLIHEKPKNWNINESVFTIKPNYEKISSEYLYMLLSSDEMRAFTTNVSAGSIHKGIRHTVLKTFKIPYKDKTITEEFATLIKPILKRIYLIDNENQKLANLRDWLLPMLMNGQVKVK
jgi:type I restriction enzyme S subunit